MGSASILPPRSHVIPAPITPYPAHPSRRIPHTHHAVSHTPITPYPAHPSRRIPHTHHAVSHTPITPYPAPTTSIPITHHAVSRIPITSYPAPITPYPASPSHHSPHPHHVIPRNHSRRIPQPSRHSRVGGNLAVCDRRHIRGHTLAPARSLDAFAEWFVESASRFPPTRE